MINQFKLGDKVFIPEDVETGTIKGWPGLFFRGIYLVQLDFDKSGAQITYREDQLEPYQAPIGRPNWVPVVIDGGAA